MSSATFKQYLKKLLLVGNFARWLKPAVRFHSADYWEARYAHGGHSGVGSYDKFAEFKASTLNQFVREKDVQDVIEFDCGDGNQLTLARYPRYTGFDVSPTAIALCRTRFAQDPTKGFRLAGEYAGEAAELVACNE